MPISRRRSEAVARESRRWLHSTINGAFREDVGTGDETPNGVLGKTSGGGSTDGMVKCDGFREMLVVVNPKTGSAHTFDVHFRAAVAIEERVNPEHVSNEDMPEDENLVIDIDSQTVTGHVGQFTQQYNIAGYRFIEPYLKNVAGVGGPTVDIVVVLIP